MSNFPNIILYSNKRSSCSWRVRLVLDYKEIPYRIVDIEKLRPEELLSINPQKKIPILKIDDMILTQSVAIMEYLEERFQDKPLTPSSILDKQRMKEIMLIIVADIQPLQNLAIVNDLAEELGESVALKWTQKRIHKGLSALEEVLKKTSNKYCIGDRFTLADCCLVPQYYNAISYFNIEKSQYPVIDKIYRQCISHNVSIHFV